MTKEEAIEKIKIQVSEMPSLKHAPAYHPAYDIWRKITKDLVQIAFDVNYARMFQEAGHLGVVSIDEDDFLHGFFDILDEQETFLNSLIGQHEKFKDDLPVSSKRNSLRDYDLHPAIKRVSGELFENGHFKEAINNAYIEVIDRVKQVSGTPRTSNGSGNELDGDKLMNQVFSPENPKIKLNELQTDADIDEQRGFMYLFKGICAIRNKKSHKNFVQNNPGRTIEHLALASLLMGVLDDEFIKTYNRMRIEPL